MSDILTLSQLKLTLAKQFELICFEDLADYYHQHRLIFDLFKKHRRDTFDVPQRLVLYSSYDLTQDYLNHIQYAAAKVDISNFFILLVTPFDLSEKIKKANALHGHDNVLINSKIFSIVDTKSFPGKGFFTNHDTICVLPFMHLNVIGQQIKPCCKFIGESLGDTSQTSITEIFNNDKMTALRADMINGNKIAACQVCWKKEENQLTSIRMHYLNKFKNNLDYGWFDDIRVRSLEFTPSTVCNFKCRICSPINSSMVAIEELKYTVVEEQREKLKKIVIAHNEDLAENVLASIDSIEYLHVFGGEPFLWKKFQDFLTTIVKSGHAKNIQIEINSNCSINPEDFKSILGHFKSVEILLSIDDIGDRFEIQRGGSWNDIVSNLEMFKKLQSSTITIKISPTVNIQNLLYLDQLVDFCSAHQLEIVWHYLEKPNFLSIFNITKKVQDIVWGKYSNHTNLELRNIAQSLKNMPTVNGEKFLNYMNELDSRRDQKFQNSHCEIVNAMQ